MNDRAVRTHAHTIALVTPSLNTAPYLTQTLESVLLQHYPSLEYVVADGGSTDGSLDIIEQYRDRLHAVVTGPDRGHADALNKGFARTSGELMGWINSDDLLQPGALAAVDAIFAAFPEVDWITGVPTNLVEGADGRSSRFAIGTGRSFTYGDFLAGDFAFIQQESTFWRRSLWERAGGALDTELRLAVDFELWMRFFRHARLHTVDALLGVFRRRDGQRSAVLYDEYFAEVKKVISRERAALRSGAIVAPEGSLDRSSDVGLRERAVRRLRSRPYRPDISRSQVDQALLQRWSRQVSGRAVPTDRR